MRKGRDAQVDHRIISSIIFITEGKRKTFNLKVKMAFLTEQKFSGHFRPISGSTELPIVQPHPFTAVNEGLDYKFIFQIFFENDSGYVECQITYFEGDVNEIAVQYTLTTRIITNFAKIANEIILVKGVPSSMQRFLPTAEMPIGLRWHDAQCAHLKIVTIKQVSPKVLSLQESFASLFLNEDMSDLKILCDEKEFPAHRFILSVRSPVFKTMFASNFTETTSKTLPIEDTDAETMEKFLRFLYTDQLKREELDCRLLILADRYQVDSLTNQCIEILQSKIDNENVIEVYYTAYLINNEKLMKKARKYAREQNGIKESPFWKELEENNPQLAMKVMKGIVFD